MSWASRRRAAYLFGVVIFFAITVGVPVAYHFLSIAPTCHDGIQNQDETSPDRGGPCLLLDAQALQPSAVLWARTFKVRDGLFDAVAYVNNPNASAGVIGAAYTLDLYDTNNILVAEKQGTTFIMPGGTTPVFVGGISTGNRDAVHASFVFSSLQWERTSPTQSAIVVTNITVSDQTTAPRVSAMVTNRTVATVPTPTFVATVFDPSGNAIASSQTALPKLAPGESTTVTFTWPEPFTKDTGRIDVIPVMAPVPDASAQQ